MKYPALSLSALVFLVACTPVGSSAPRPSAPLPEPPPSGEETVEVQDLEGNYDGNLVIDEELFGATMVVSGNRRRPDIVLHLEGGLIEAEGEGSYENGVLSADLPYGETECRGTLTLSGQWVDGGEWLSGRFHAEDCTGVIEGRFSMRPVGDG